MTHTAKLTAADGAEDDQFGISVAIDGGTVVAGAWSADVGGKANQGAAYVFGLVQLNLGKTVDDETPAPGQTITYTIVVSNSGVTATGAVVSDTLPTGLNFVGPVTIQGSGGTTGTPPTLASGLTISAGQRITLTFPVTVSTNLAAASLLTNTAEVTSTAVSAPVSGSRVVTVTQTGIYLPFILK